VDRTKPLKGGVCVGVGGGGGGGAGGGSGGEWGGCVLGGGGGGGGGWGGEMALSSFQTRMSRLIDEYSGLV